MIQVRISSTYILLFLILGCYEKRVTYINQATNEPVPLTQIDALIQVSDYCEQGFWYECTLAPLRIEEVDFAFWTDRNGEQNIYFTGANKGFHSCDCHFSEEGCAEENTRGNTCNCDANLPTPLTDSGTLTNTTALPVTKLSFGGLTYEIQSGAFQLGNLKCFGKKNDAIGSSCSSLKLKGNTLSGYYDIKKPGDQYTSLVFCDMSENGYQNIPQTDQPERSSPLGTIAAWIEKPDVEASQEDLPQGWVFCNASLIENGPWAGSKTPDLNNGHFLRGGDFNEHLMKEEDQLQDHQHTDPGHTHSASSTSPPHQHTSTDKYINSDGSGVCLSTGPSCTRGTMTYARDSSLIAADVTTSISSHTTGISGVTDSYRKGDETRPKNMKISWIMKCW